MSLHFYISARTCAEILDEKVTYVFRLFGFLISFFAFPFSLTFSYLFAAVVNLLQGLPPIQEFPRKHHWDGKFLPWSFPLKFLTIIFPTYFRINRPNHSDLGTIGKIFSSCRPPVQTYKWCQSWSNNIIMISDLEQRLMLVTACYSWPRHQWVESFILLYCEYLRCLKILYPSIFRYCTL